MIDPILASFSSVGQLYEIARAGATGADRQSPVQADAAQARGQAVADQVEISPEARLAAREAGRSKESSGSRDADVQTLRQRDQEVRAHEAAHKAAAGQYGGPISYSFETGPDGQRYAVGGNVPIDLSTVDGDPGATIQKMEQVMRAALAPADPSPEDREIAARAAGQLQEARQELTAGQVEGASGLAPGGDQRSPGSGPYQSGGAPSVATLLDTYA